MRREIEVVTLSFERIGDRRVFTVELGLWKGAWIILDVADEDGLGTTLQQHEVIALRARAAAGEDESGEDWDDD